MVKNQVVTGELLLENHTLNQCNNGRIYSICKQSILEFLSISLEINPTEVISIGDGYVDIDMIKSAGIGIAYRAPPEVQKYANLATDDLRTVLKYI